MLKQNARDNDALILRGNLALARGDAPAAIADLRAVLRDQPNSVPVMRALARAHLRNNELALAEETLRSAAQANPADRDVRLRAVATAGAERSPGAGAAGARAAGRTSRPSDVATLEALFRVQAALKDLKAARATAEDIKRVRPDLPLGSVSGRDRSTRRSRSWMRAAAAYERALEIQPTAGEPLTALVRVDARAQAVRSRRWRVSTRPSRRSRTT